jgi:hypothetical protein
MPAMHALFHKFLRRFRESSSFGSKGDGVSKGSYMRHHSSKRQNSLPFGSIKKSTDVNIYRTERSSSDVELVNQLPRT